MSLQRYARQMLLPQLGDAGQQQLLDARVLIVGAGGLGSAAAGWLAGAGVGELTIVDGDRVALSNLHRQLFFRETDIGQPKVGALATALRERNAGISIRAIDAMADAENLPGLLADTDLVLDCSDNFPTRYTLNAACVAQRRDLLSAAAIRLEGLLLALAPGRAGQACYHCVFPQQTGAGAAEACEDAGVLGPSVGVVASLQATQAITILTGRSGFNRLWRWAADDGTLQTLSLRPDPACPICQPCP